MSLFFYRQSPEPVVINLSSSLNSLPSGFSSATVDTNQTINATKTGTAVITLKSNYYEANGGIGDASVTIEVLVDGNSVLAATNPAFVGDSPNPSVWTSLTSSAFPITTGNHTVTYRTFRPGSSFNRGWVIEISGTVGSAGPKLTIT